MILKKIGKTLFFILLLSGPLCQTAYVGKLICCYPSYANIVFLINDKQKGVIDNLATFPITFQINYLPCSKQIFLFSPILNQLFFFYKNCSTLYTAHFQPTELSFERKQQKFLWDTANLLFGKVAKLLQFTFRCCLNSCLFYILFSCNHLLYVGYIIPYPNFVQ